ncbi:hypothetical protein U9M48_001602 [Paspalum notatum var. saurae]|uniref:Uncharacterized protein n=1 Tax=Paspalum notatum var. saurae TaxID=547442 RepID=A0AAQ3SGU6_PASNO
MAVSRWLGFSRNLKHAFLRPWQPCCSASTSVVATVPVSMLSQSFSSQINLSLSRAFVSSPRAATALACPTKVTIPLRKVKAVRPCENKHRPEQNYVHLHTNDGLEFWFLGFVSYNRLLQHLEQAVPYAQQHQLLDKCRAATDQMIKALSRHGYLQKATRLQQLEAGLLEAMAPMLLS